ncbi:MAG: DUF1329 domain-containing protein [Gammaproteobacteria bacterium]|nr:DUF1329 domain-containing protein [Gammaproteobacteria bacterium]
MNKLICASVLSAVALHPLAAVAAEGTTPDAYVAWFNANQAAKPQFVDGDTITFDKADMIRPFIPAEYQGEMIYEGMSVHIKDAGDITPPQSYKDATAKFQPQVTLESDGAIKNYVAGLPFDPAKFQAGSAEDGTRLAWNFNFRWQNQGLQNQEVHWVWVRKGGSHDGHEVMNDRYKAFYKGGGTFERVLTGPYQRVYLSHRVDLPDSNYRVAGSWADNTEFREYTGFTSPFDIAGTAFLILRYDDPRKTDDSWAYIPSLRRVRRISVEVKSDSLLGTDHTLEDFYCFAGRPLEWNWKYLGTAKTLAVARSKNAHTIYGGPSGWVPVEDDWALRTVDVVQATPKRDNHPYSTKFMHFDRDSGECYYANAYDRGNKLWKVWQLSKVFTDDPWYVGQKDFKAGDTPPGTRMSAFQSINVIDMQNSRGTLVPCRGSAYPNNRPEDVKRIMDVNYLTEGRR